MQGAGATPADPIGSNNAVTFDSSQSATAAYRPVLTVYTVS